MFTGKIEFTGATVSDVEAAIEEALRSVKEGNTTGFDHNDSGSYNFELSEAAPPRVAYHADESFVHPVAPDPYIVAKITEGEPGYQIKSGTHPTVESAKAAADALNLDLGLSAEDVLAIRTSSMAASNLTEPARTVHILTIDHRHGTDTFVVHNPGQAEEMIGHYVDEWWETDGPDEPMPEDAEEKVARYFEFQAGRESYSITEARIEPAGGRSA